MQINLLSLAVNADASRLKQILRETNFLEYTNEKYDESTNKNRMKTNLRSSDEDDHDEKLERFEEALSNAWTESQTKQAMEILQGFARNVSQTKRQNAYVSKQVNKFSSNQKNALIASIHF